MIRWGIWIGTTSGIVLGMYMWYVELVTGKKIYTLLMNVDFIPLIGSVDWPIVMEWLFHMLISWVIGVLFAYVFMKKRLKPTNQNQWLLAIILSAGAAATYAPLTILAIKDTPALTDGIALLYWLIGHVLYAITLKKSYHRS